MKFFKKLLKPINIFIIIFILGLFIRYFFGEKSTLWSIWNSIDVSFAVSLGILAFFAYKDMTKDDDEIKIYFYSENKEYPLNLSLLRKDCTRGEVIGLLGMLQRKTNNRFYYDPKHLKEFLNELNKVQQGKKDKLLIPINKEELKQFVLNN